MNIRQAPVRLVREPILHFLAIGALLFALDHYVLSNADDPRSIVIDAARREELRAIFEDGQGREPSPEELQRMILEWSQNEVLYREAKIMGLDQGDDMIRQRLILKLRNILFGNIVIPAPADGELKAWFEEHKADYDLPAAYDFEQFQVVELRDVAPDSEQAIKAAVEAKALVEALGTGEPSEAQGEMVRLYRNRPMENLVSLFGQAQAETIANSAEGQWTAARSPRGWHAVRIVERRAARSAEFKTVRSRVVRAWQEDARKQSLADSLKEIVERFDIRVVGDGTEPSRQVELGDLPQEPVDKAATAAAGAAR